MIGRRSFLPRAASVLCSLVAVGCLQLEYLVQAAAGQDEIAYRARPIAEVLADPHEDANTRRMLSAVGDVKEFAAANGLIATSSYSSYADLERSAVVWVVTAAPALSLVARTWTFPIVGDVPYLGWFERRDAERFAAGLRDEQLDVYLRPARAYSTLGWFEDPVLSTMLGPREHRGDSELAALVEVVLHESLHGTAYVKSQSLYNESLASFVAEELTARYLDARGHVGGAGSAAYTAELARDRARAQRMLETRASLEVLYRSPLRELAKLAEKRRIFDALERELGLAGKLNNAALAQSQTYHAGGAAFATLFAACGGDMRRFLAAVGTLTEEDFTQPQLADLVPLLRPLVLRHCATP
ncbi:MAG: hypothetical protein EXR75_04265 [Myxococcales bacterium]|nr:hypothetical protein [Myxococcales bacterium]